MTQEPTNLYWQKIVKLAEWYGWKWDGPYFAADNKSEEFWSLENEGIFLGLPDYFGDLNPVRELENKLPKNQLGAYHTLLADFMEQKHKDDPNMIQGYARSMAISASAEERSETLGKFLNLW